MGWLPETLDAITRMGKELGIGGLVVMAFMVFLTMIGLIAYRHANAILLAINTFLEHKGEEIAEWKTQTAILRKLEPSLEKLNKIPSDLASKLEQVCKAQPACANFKPLLPEYIEMIAKQHGTTPEEIVEIINELNPAHS